jgi:AcrR family transcriptional regulator
VSLRTIVTQAQVNLAAIHYHFGSKEALFEAVFARRASAIATEREASLAKLSEGDTLPSIEQVLRAFLEPGLRPERPTESMTGGAVFARLRARLMADDTEFSRALQAKYFDNASSGFVVLLRQLLPHLSQAELYWRFHFMLGSMMYQMAGVDRICQLSKGRFSAADNRVALDRMVALFSAAFRRPEDGAVPAARTASRRLSGAKPQRNLSR